MRCWIRKCRKCFEKEWPFSVLFSQKEKRLLALKLQHEDKVFYLHPRYSLAYPLGYWAMMGLVSLALTVILLIRKKCPVYGAVAMGLTG